MALGFRQLPSDFVLASKASDRHSPDGDIKIKAEPARKPRQVPLRNEGCNLLFIKMLC